MSKTPFDSLGSTKTMPRCVSVLRRPWLVRDLHRRVLSCVLIPTSQDYDHNDRNGCTATVRQCFALAAALLLCIGPTSAVATPPEELLLGQNLQRVERTWLLREEIELHAVVEMLESLDKKLKETKRAADAELQTLEQLRAQIKTATEARERMSKVLKTAPQGPLRTMLERDHKEQGTVLTKLNELLPPADTLGGLAPLKGLLAEQCALHAECCLRVLEADRLVATMNKQYSALNANSKIATALAEIGNQTLGPNRKWATDQPTLNKNRKTAFGPTVPFYREGKRVRVSLIWNDEFPATLSWHDEHEATLLPYSLAQSLGLHEQLPAKTEQLTMPREKLNLSGWFQTLKRVRLGQSTMEQVPVFILTPEHEALGGRLGYQLQQDMILSLDTEKLVVRCGKTGE